MTGNALNSTFIGFEAARGHKMERENYVESLKAMTAKLHVAEIENEIHHGNSRTISTQTEQGVWLATKKSRKRRTPDDDINDARNVKGTVYVDGSNLISDGAGRYFMQVDLNDVRPVRNNNTFNSHNNAYAYNNQRFYPPSRRPNDRYDSSHSSQAYYSNQNTSRRSHYRSNEPNPNGTYFANQTPYPKDRSYGSQQTYCNDESELFKS